MAKKHLNSIQLNRQLAFNLQSGLCYYCSQPMWCKDKQKFVQKYKINPTLANYLQCTAEHLIARQDGGDNTKFNIVAVCKFCNHTRHKSKNALAPDSYKKRVQKRLANKSWHGIILNPLIQMNI